MARTPIKVLIVDDSALMRRILSEALGAEPDVEVVGVASDPLVARELIKQRNPDVLTLDIEMPRMDGLAFLEKIMTLRPMPVIMVSTLTEAGAEATLRALELGAFDYIPKPKLDLQRGFDAVRAELVRKVRAAAGARVRGAQARPVTPAPGAPSGRYTGDKIVAIGASTGGVETLQEIICALPLTAPPIVVTQHMPARFTASFAARLDRMASVHVREAEPNSPLRPGDVYIAPGDAHLVLGRDAAGGYACRIEDGPLISGHRPSVDALFHSVARVAGPNAVGVILTGMGRDGAEGLLAMRRAGAFTMGESEQSCVVYGMPRAAREIGATAIELPSSRIAAEILLRCDSRTQKS